jgi:hypothetical protein
MNRRLAGYLVLIAAVAATILVAWLGAAVLVGLVFHGDQVSTP